MPALKEPRWERACQLRAAGGGITASYEGAGYAKGGPGNAVKFFRRPEIVQRVQEIVQDGYEDERKSREIATQEAGIDKAWVLKRLKYLTDLSLQKKEVRKGGQVVGYTASDGATAVKCLTLASQLGGWLVQRHELGGPGEFSRMTDEELGDSLVTQAQALGLPEEAVARLLTFQGAPPAEDEAE